MSGTYCCDGSLCMIECPIEKRRCDGMKPLMLWEVVEINDEVASLKDQLAAREAKVLEEVSDYLKKHEISASQAGEQSIRSKMRWLSQEMQRWATARRTK